MTEALQSYLDDLEDRDAFREDVIELFLAGELGYSVLEEGLGRKTQTHVGR